ncbi:MAG: hypothetical protein AUG51_04805 [Acidobacteria bacterium 13_1_20CM_3_53_8]|nr:MAG: hypothetical protein AUG51_04805 [Acidobacteria bacterium 13_1_20CM_3_53_8]
MSQYNQLALIHLSNVVGRKIFPKLFVVVLSHERNLEICRDSCTAGFPDTFNGQWAYLDIDEGDYISMYFNGRLLDLYIVERKFIPDIYKDERATGEELEDPVPVRSGEKWVSISNAPKIYFPYRLELTCINRSTFDTSLVFRAGLERLGINLIPRVSLKKTHFQLSLKEGAAYFNFQRSGSSRQASFASFLECAARESAIQSLTNAPSHLAIADITLQECYLQALMKKLLEWAWNDIAGIIDFEQEAVEFLSEQTVHGGQADIVILQSERGLEFFIEVKNKRIINRDTLSRDGIRASHQVKGYQSLTYREHGTKRGIAGKASQNNGTLLIGQIDDILVFELDSAMPISYLTSLRTE